MMSHLPHMPGGSALLAHLRGAGFKLAWSRHADEGWERGDVRVLLTLAKPDDIMSDLDIDLHTRAGEGWVMAGSVIAVRPLDAVESLDGLVRVSCAAHLALLLPGPQRSANAESTAAPWWAILDPGRSGKHTGTNLSGAITGPFLTREAAEDFFEAGRYRFGPHAAVWCLSGHASPEWCALPVAPKAGQ